MPTQTHTKKDDNELLALFYNDKNNEWVGILLQRYTLLLLGICMKYLKNEEEAKDSVQQIFIKVLTELPKYKVDYFKSWLYSIAKNYCLMKIRSNSIRFTELNNNMYDTTATMPDNDEWWEREYSLELLETSMQLLNLEQQQCIMLFYHHKLSYRQIVKQTGYTMMQVKSYIQNGKRNLRLHMEKMKNE